jgi:hydroxymethylglutaryl-CoA lyase
MEQVLIRDCGPRDGLQGERPRSAAERVALVEALAAAGLPEVEVASFVSPKAVPAMAGGADVVAALDDPGDARWWALVPNVRGAELALASGIRHLTVTVSASEGYSAKNVGMSVAESLGQLAGIRAAAAPPVRVDAVVSCCFGSPFDDVSVRSVTEVVATVRSTGVDRVTLADTTGTATPRRIAAVVDAVDIAGSDVGLHLHDTRGTALTNAHAALQMGIRRFDTAVGGLGGSPFAPGSGGNLATEDLVLLLEDLGHDTGIDLARLLAIGEDLAALVGHELPGRVMAAGPLAPFPD